MICLGVVGAGPGNYAQKIYGWVCLFALFFLDDDFSVDTQTNSRLPPNQQKLFLSFTVRSSN